MIKFITAAALVAGLAALSSGANAQICTTSTDFLGNTRTNCSNGTSSTANTDFLGNTRTQIQMPSGQTRSCISSTDFLGNVRTNCN